MKIVIQRVLEASVEVGGKVISKINKGLLVLVGIHKDDKKEDADFICRKVLNTRVFDNDEEKPWTKSVVDKNYEILFVSQFTLYGVLKGNKPDYHNAMPPTQAKEFYSNFLGEVRKTYKADKIFDGEFGAMMKVNLVNDGPVTLVIESNNNNKKDE
jgi:D-tyrosyl-tRNA(Tyr) deacylase